MNAYSVAKLIFNAYGVLDGNIITGYMKLKNKVLKGKTPQNRPSDILFDYTHNGDRYITLVGFDLNTETGEFTSGLERVLDSVDHMSRGRVELVQKQFQGDEEAFYHHVIRLLGEEFPKMLESAEIAGKRVLSCYLKTMTPFSHEFIKLFDEGYHRGGAYVFDQLKLNIEPNEWGVLKLVGKGKDRHPDTVCVRDYYRNIV